MPLSYPYAPGGWITALDGDFTTASTQTLSSDTTYTIFGQTWTKINSANDNTAMAISSTGLDITPKQSTVYTNSSRTCPAIVLPVTNLIPNFDMSGSLRFYMQFADNQAANFDNIVMSIETSTLGDLMGYRLHGHNSGGTGYQHF